MAKSHVLIIRRNYGGSVRDEVAGVFSSAKAASEHKDRIWNAYKDDRSGVAESYYSIFTSRYPRCASEVVFENGDYVGVWVESMETNTCIW